MQRSSSSPSTPRRRFSVRAWSIGEALSVVVLLSLGGALLFLLPLYCNLDASSGKRTATPALAMQAHQLLRDTPTASIKGNAAELLSGLRQRLDAGVQSQRKAFQELHARALQADLDRLAERASAAAGLREDALEALRDSIELGDEVEAESVKPRKLVESADWLSVAGGKEAGQGSEGGSGSSAASSGQQSLGGKQGGNNRRALWRLWGAASDHDGKDAAQTGRQPAPRPVPIQNKSPLQNGVAELHSAIDAKKKMNTMPLTPSSEAQICDTHFGLGWLERWDATAKVECTGKSAAPQQPQLRLGFAAEDEQGPAGGDVPAARGWRQLPAKVTCRRQADEHMTNASRPHVLCDAQNLLVDPSRMRPANCLKYRPGYLCDSRTYHQYKRGAFGATCSWPAFDLDAFPKDHLRDIFDSLQTQPAEGPWVLPEPADIVEEPTLVVTREIHEHENVFHTLTDLLNVYITTRLMGWQRVRRRVLVLDDHPPGALDGLWGAVASGGGLAALDVPWDKTEYRGRRAIMRAGDLQGPTLFSHAAFVPPGYTSLLFSDPYSNGSCPHATPLFQGFRKFVLAPLQLYTEQPTSGSAVEPLRVLLVSRRPYPGKSDVRRRISNEMALARALVAIPGVEAGLLDLGSIPLLQQLELLTEIDIIVGMHGAAMAWTLLMPPHGAAVELWPEPEGQWRCYEHTSHWAGLLYRRWVSPVASQGATEVDVAAVQGLVQQLVPLVIQRKRVAAGQLFGVLPREE